MQNTIKTDNSNKKERFVPDFIIIPSQVVFSEDLQYSDKILYGIIYWFEHLKEGRCIASNQTLANISGITKETVVNCLTRLEQSGFIQRFFNDEIKNDRKCIKTLINYRRIPVKKEGVTIKNTEGVTIKNTGGLPLKTGTYKEHLMRNDTNVSQNQDFAPPLEDSELHSLTVASESSNTAPLKNQDFKNILGFYAKRFEEQFNSKPSINSLEAIAVHRVLKENTVDEAKEMIEFYLRSEKAKDVGISLAIIFSVHSINLFKQNNHKNKFIYK